MKNESMIQKLGEFKKYVDEFVQNSKEGVEDIHKLRVNSRELYSLMSHDEVFYKKLKKIIKLSNKVRDLDVFFEEYLTSLPKVFFDLLDIESITEISERERQKDVDKLHLYLKQLEVPQSVEFKYEKKMFDTSKIRELCFNEKELHRYRIYIKKKLYNEKNTQPLNKKKIKILTKIKDILGTINDNNNALERLKSHHIGVVVLAKIENFTQERNRKLFEEFLIVNKEITA